MKMPSLTLLLIDDKQDTLLALASRIADVLPGCVALTARDGVSGIALARHNDPDVILFQIGRHDCQQFLG